MNRETRGGLARRTGLAALSAMLLLPTFVAGQSVAEKYRQARERSSPFNLSSSANSVLQVNKFQCGLSNKGFVCTNVFDSPTGGGGFWPTGTVDQYMFRSGGQIFGIIPGSKADNPWAGDTVGAFFNEGTGQRGHGTPVTEIYNSLDPNDLANWPDVGSVDHFPEATAWVTDTSLFNDVLIGRKAASQQDTWQLYWDGDPGPTLGRNHPMGILVEQRSLAWNYPSGNEAIIYFIYKFTNVTNNPYFQQLNEAKFFGGANQLPDGGWRIDSIYVAVDSDADVDADKADQNYATGILPFNLGIAYLNSFYEPAFDYPPSEFHAPFFPAAVGIVGVKFLKSPTNPATGKEVGLTSLSLHTNGGAFPDPANVQRGWRYVSLNVDAGKGDPNCTFSINEVKARRACYLGQTASDVRFFIGSGPFSLDPGQSATVAVAMYAAATVATSQIQITADNKPGIPSIHPGCFGDPIRPIEVGSGWVKTNTCPSDPADAVDQHDVQVVTGSLLGKGLVAQAIFDNKFLLGFAPETPTFQLVPGNNQITVVWEPSNTEKEGDPFFVAAGDPNSPLYDPNYRQFNVEGYRIYRGTTPGNLHLIAQFDKKGSVFEDNLCVTDPTFVVGDTCPGSTEVDLTGAFVQYPPGGVVRLADGTPLVVKADTALAAEIAAGNGQPLSDTGIPYAYVDKDVRNGFQYFYKVTAFDINSLNSGPSSLESAGGSKNTTPRAAATSLADAQFAVGLFGRGNTPLTGQAPSIDPVTGEFSGPAAPTGLMTGEFLPFAAQLLPAGTKEIRIDSVVPGYYPNGVIATFYVTADGQHTSVQFSNGNVSGGHTDPETHDLPVVSVASDPTIRQQLIAKGVDAPASAGSLTAQLASERPHWGSVDSDWAFKQPGFWDPYDPPTTLPGGSRWFTGANEATKDPTAGYAAGFIQGYTIFKPEPYQTVAPAPTGATALTAFRGQSGDIMRRFYGTTFGAHRAADMKFYWSTAGLDSVIDVTHNVTVPFAGAARASFGFLTDNGDKDGKLTYGDFYYIPGFESTGNIGSFSQNSPAPLSRQPVSMPVDVTGDLQPDGNGFGIYIAGEPFLFMGPVPTSGVWTLRTYAGTVTQNSAGQYSFTPYGAFPAVPGLRFVVNVTAPATIVADQADLSKVHTVPDPYYAVSQFELGPSSKELHFINLPAKATIRIYSMSGVLVDILNHDNVSGSGQEPWDLRNRSGQFVASGVYFYHLSTPDGKTAIGKFTVINSGFAR